MMKDCRKSCAEYAKHELNFDKFHVGEDDESFFDLSAKTFTGETLNFDRFEGYVSCSCYPSTVTQIIGIHSAYDTYKH